MLAKNNGIVIACRIPMNLSLVFMKVAKIMEKAVSPAAPTRSASRASASARGLRSSLAPNGTATRRITKSWMSALAAPANDLPSTIVSLLSGSVSTSFRIPDSLSQTSMMP